MKKILVTDIGGTNSRFAYFIEDQKRELTVTDTQWYKTKDYSSFAQVVEQLRASTFSLSPEEADVTVIAIAGPVEDGVYSSPPFIEWDIDISHAEHDFGFKKCFLINDFIAQAFACRSPIAESADEILSGRIISSEPAVILGAGTALGMATIVPDNTDGFIAVPSEGGHANFPFSSDRECEFQEFLLKELGEAYVTNNHIVSGRGLSYIHRFLTGEVLEPAEVTFRKFGKGRGLCCRWSCGKITKIAYP
jgi:glucokinase